MGVATKASRRTAKPKAKKRSSWWRRIKIAFAVFLILGEAAFIYASYEGYKRLEAASLVVPNMPDIMAEISSSPSQIVAADGTVLFTIQTEYRKPVHRSDIPQNVVNATLAAEDKRFYSHIGVDPIAIGRILYRRAKDDGNSGGGSTLTMQLSKRVYTSSEQSLERKLKDMALAVQIERMLTKDQILELYVNQIFYGQGAYGIQAAADVYFGKKLDELTIAEAALLSRCVRRPSDENPFVNMDRAVTNRNVVLKIMRDEGMISEGEYQEAKNEEVKLRKEKPRVITAKKTAPYFVDYVLAELKKEGIDISRGGYRIETTLDMRYQEITDAGVKWGLRNSPKSVNQMAFLLTDTKGRILGMTPGPSYEKSQFNMMWMGRGRQPGSSFKPLVYAAGIELGVFGSRSTISTEPYMIIDDRGRKRPIKGGANRGNVSIASALAASMNTPAVRAQSMIGTRNFIRFAQTNFGFKTSNLPIAETLVLGAGEAHMLEMASAYNTFQNNGTRYPTYAIEKVVEPDGTIRYLNPNPQSRALSPGTAKAMDAFLRGVVTGGTGRAARGTNNARGKTGTTSNNKDAWFCGYTDTLLGIVWLGNEVMENGRPVSKPMYGVEGGSRAAPVWNYIMSRAQKVKGEKSRSFSGVPNVGNVRESEQENNDNTPDPIEDPLPEQPPTVIDETGETTPPPLQDPPGMSTGGTTGDTTGGTTGRNSTTTTTTGGGGGGSTSGGGGGGTTGATIYVNICADSGQKSTVYCPETVRRPFTKGKEPRGVCPIHGPR
ncbi:MAG: transglycosylase domain-containing protein [Fimbriimonadaceae bacterium]